MNALILMTRIPIPGQTKTRLMDIMYGEECALLHMSFLKDLMTTFEELKNDLDIYLTYTPEDSMGVIEEIVPDFIQCFPQRGEDLGEKMYNGFLDIFSKGYKKVVLMGSDIPDIKGEDILLSFNILDTKDIVLGPSYDGGYYLIGMKNLNKNIFNITKKWGGKSVLEATIDISNNDGLAVGLAPKYRDIDTREDLFEFINKYEYSKNPTALNTVEFIKEWREKRWSKTN